MLTSRLKTVTSLGLTTRHRKLLVLVVVGMLGVIVFGVWISSTNSPHKPSGSNLGQWKRAKVRDTHSPSHTHTRTRKVHQPAKEKKNHHHRNTRKDSKLRSRHNQFIARHKGRNRRLRKISEVFATLTTIEIVSTVMDSSTIPTLSSPAQQLTENTENRQSFTDSGDGMAGHENFDAERVYNLFCSCRKDNDVLLLDCYVNAYEELCKLFRVFGTVFSFVSSDVEEKIGILRDYRKSEHAEQYKTIQSMLAYEVASDTVKKKKSNSGSRTLLRLHRALEFIMEFLLKLKESDNRCKFSNVVTKAYDDTLAKHHPWLVKKAVHVAMYMLPSRPDLMKKMGLKDEERDMNVVMELVKELNLIYKITQELYAKDKLLDLP